MAQEESETYRNVRELIAHLESVGDKKSAERLRSVLETAYTTGSEFWGELGLALGDVKKSGNLPRNIPKQLKRLLPFWRWIF